MYVRSQSNVGGLVAVLVVLVFCGLVVAKCALDSSGTSHRDAQQAADQFIKSNGLNAKANCAQIDTDHDGYISCTLVTTKTDGSFDIQPLECAGSLTINDGCRVPKFNVRR